MGGARETYRGQDTRIQGLGGEGRGKEATWEDNIKTDLQEVGWGGMDWIDLAEDRDRLL